MFGCQVWTRAVNLVLHHYNLDMSHIRINILESNEEYMMEEPTEHQFCWKDVKSFDVHERTTNDEEGFTDCDDVDVDENEDAENA